MNRRDFLTGSVLAMTAAQVGHTDTKRGDALPIVDTHQHLWDLKRFRLAWTKTAPKLARNYLPDDYRQATAGLNVVKAVYMEVDVDPDQQTQEAEYVIGLCEKGEKPT